ncbi:response regulator [bacterium]|nr:response regulator [bacterium]
MTKKILLIEDEMPAIDIYEKVLNKAGFKTKSLINGREALSELRKIKHQEKARPDLILLDLILPDINGIEILKEIKSWQETRDIPVVILTNYRDVETEQRGEELGANAYIIKTNITPQEILGIVRKYLN